MPFSFKGPRPMAPASCFGGGGLFLFPGWTGWTCCGLAVDLLRIRKKANKFKGLDKGGLGGLAFLRDFIKK